MVTGEAATPALINQWLESYPNVTPVNAYGPTEAADDICQGVLERPLESERPTVPIGQPLRNLRLYVLDRNLRLVPEGVPGEICVSGIAVGAGYWGDEAPSRDSFRPNPFSAEAVDDILYRTGDFGRWLADGNLECVERLDNQVKLRSFRIELGELENVLAAHPAVREAAVTVWKENDDAQLVGYVVANTESPELQGALESLRRDQVDLWQDLHEDSYTEELLLGDPTFNVISWDTIIPVCRCPKRICGNTWRFRSNVSIHSARNTSWRSASALG
jgi:acyl-coenzyme A synthetase/AMP-(fatty) acid ligase